MTKAKIDKGITLIAANARVEGDIRFSGELYVSGSVTGNITAEKSGKAAALVVAEGGSVKGEVRVANAVIAGDLEGDMHVRERLEMSKTAKVRGDVYYKLVELTMGAILEGRLVRGEQAAAESGRARDARAAPRRGALMSPPAAEGEASSKPPKPGAIPSPAA